MLSSTIAANINGKLPLNKQVGKGSCSLSSSVLSSRIDFTLTVQVKNAAQHTHQRESTNKCLNQLNNKGVSGHHSLYTSSRRPGMLDHNKNSPAKHHSMMNGNKEKGGTSEDGVPVPRVQLFQPGKINLEWRQVHKIGAGLHNLGNTCFMNTVIQCLTYCPPLANYLLHDTNHAAKCKVIGFCMMCELQKHMKRVIDRPGDAIKPINIYHKLKSIAKHFQYGTQEDAHEFLRYVIDNLWKSCLANYDGHVKLDPASKETTVINHIFGGYHQSQVTCLRCKEKSNTYDHFMDFILDIKQNVLSLEKALEKFIQPELLQNENSYKCPQCKVKVSAHKRFSVHRAPNVATFQFKRFDYNKSYGGKITKHIAYPENFDLRPFMSENKGPPVIYRLNAVLVHLGPTCNSGHYFCYVKNSNGYWYLMDDSRVSQVTLNQVLNQAAYVLFYIRQKNPENANIKRPLETTAMNHKNSPVMRNGISSASGHESSGVGMSRPSQSLRSSPMTSASRLAASTSTGSLPNGTPHCVNRKPQPQPLCPNRDKVSFEIMCFGSKSNKHVKNPASETSSAGCSKSTPVSEKSNSRKPNTLVPYGGDSSESSDDDVQKKSGNIKMSLAEVQNIPLPSASSSAVNSDATQSHVPSSPQSSADENTINFFSDLTDDDKRPCLPENSVSSEHKTSSSDKIPDSSVSNVAPSHSLKIKSTFQLSVIDSNLHSPSIASGSSTNSVGSTTDWDITEQESISKKKNRRNYSGWNIQNINQSEKNNSKETVCKSLTADLNEACSGNSVSTEESRLDPSCVESEDISFHQNHSISKSSESSRSVALSSNTSDKSNPSQSTFDSVKSAERTPLATSSSKKPFLAAAEHERRKTLAFRDFKSEKSFLAENGKESCKTGVKNSLKRPLGKFLENDSDSRDAKFSNSGEDCDNSVHKRCKTKKVEHVEDDPLVSVEEASVVPNGTCSNVSGKNCSGSDVNIAGNDSVDAEKVSINAKDSCFTESSSSPTHTERTNQHVTHKRKRYDDSDVESSCDSGCGYEWVEKTKESMEVESKLLPKENTGDREGRDSDTGVKNGLLRSHHPDETSSSPKQKSHKPDAYENLMESSNYAYGAPVDSWNGTVNSVDRKHYQKENQLDGFDDMLLRKAKRAKKFKRHSDPYNYQYNPFQRVQNMRSRQKAYSDDYWSSTKQLKKKYFNNKHNRRYSGYNRHSWSGCRRHDIKHRDYQKR